MSLPPSFSARHRYSTAAKEITIREDAPESLRYVALDAARGLGFGPSVLREVVCRVLRQRPDTNNWSEYPNVWGEVQHLIDRCEWFRGYDVIEALDVHIARHDYQYGRSDAVQYENGTNSLFVETGIGWQLANRQIVTRGDAAFETLVASAQTQLQAEGRPTAAKRIKDALECLSRRPEPNSAGAVYHAMGSLECVARDVAGDPKATLGEILKRHPGLLPKPLDTALSQVWSFASNEARHVQEGRDIGREEAELLVGLSATVGTYLSGKTGQ